MNKARRACAPGSLVLNNYHGVIIEIIGLTQKIIWKN